MALRSLSLCAGIGGADIGLESIGAARAVCYVERESFSAACLVAAMSEGRLAEAPVWSDLRTFDARAWRGAVDLVVAGFPCQAFSTASRGRRVADDLWPECLRIIEECWARVVFAENVSSVPIQRAANDLVARGFRAAMAPISSSQLGFAHHRSRWWLLAHSDTQGELLRPEYAQVARMRRDADARARSDSPPFDVGVDDGVPDRMDRLAALGNAIVPDVAALAFTELFERLAQ